MIFGEFIQKNKKIIKFAVSGSVVALVEFNLLYFFTEVLGYWYLFSSGISFSVAFVISFTMQKFWTFRDYCREQIYRQLSLYLIIGLINLLFNQVILFIAVEFFGFWYFGAQIVITSFLGLLSFLFYKIFIFRKIKKECPDKRHILIATGIFPPDLGGPATFVSALAADLVLRGYGVVVLTFGEHHDDDLILPYRLYRISRRSNLVFRYLRYFFALWHLSASSDVVVALDLLSVGLPSAWAKLMDRRLRLIVRIGGDQQWEKSLEKGWFLGTLDDYYTHSRVWNLQERLIQSLSGFVMRMCDRVVFNSELMRDIYIKHRKINPLSTSVIKNIKPNCASQDVHPPKYTGSQKRTKTIFYAGRLVAFKNLDSLIKSFRKLADNNSELSLLICGDGPQSDKLATLVNELSLLDRVKFSDKLNRKDLFEKIAGSDVVVVPSWTEVNGNFVSEVMSVGVPIVLSKQSEHYYTGNNWPGLYYCDPSDSDDIAIRISDALQAKVLISPAVFEAEDQSHISKAYLELINRLES